MRRLQLALTSVVLLGTLAAIWMGGAAGWPRCC
jgi:hypothetical protein